MGLMKKFKSPAIHRTPLYRARRAYKDMLVRCENQNGKNPAYSNVKVKMTMEEWLAWAVPRYEKFVRDHPNESPSVSRFGDNGDYELTNIEIITFVINRSRQSMPNVLGADGTKICGRCRETKTAEHFVKNASRPDGLAHWCRGCMSAWNNGSVTRAAKGSVS